MKRVLLIVALAACLAGCRREYTDNPAVTPGDRILFAVPLSGLKEARVIEVQGRLFKVEWDATKSSEWLRHTDIPFAKLPTQ